MLRAPVLYRAECGHDVRGLGERHLGGAPRRQPPHHVPAGGDRVRRIPCCASWPGPGRARPGSSRCGWRAAVRDGSIEADRTLVTTFSRKAADELRTRLWSLGVSGVKAGTFHRTALGLLREHRELRGRPLPQLLPDRRRLLADVTTGDPRRTRALDGEIGWAKARLVAPDRYEAEARRHRRRPGISPEQVADAYAQLRERAHAPAAARLRRPDRRLRRRAGRRSRVRRLHPLAHPPPLRRRDAGREPRPVPAAHDDAGRRARPLRGGRPQPVRVRVQRRRPHPARPAARHPARHQGHPPRREPPLHAPGGGGGDRGAARGRGGGCGGRAAHDADRRAGAQGGGARLRGRRGGMGGGTGQDVADAGAAVVEHRRAHPHERPARQGAGGHGRRPGAEHDRRRRPRPGIRPARRARPAGHRPRPRRGVGRAGDPCDRDRWCSRPSTGPRACSGRR